jgi:Na+-transporting NADH:ubiquinone oxidoreductase subunit D
MKASFRNAFTEQHLILSLGLGLFILLAGGQSLTSAWMMTWVLFVNLFFSTSILFLLRSQIQEENQWIIILFVMGSVATWVQMMAVAFLPGWVMGIEDYLPLIAISGLILARVETVVKTETYGHLFMNTLGSVLGFAFLVLPIGFFADLLGQGVITFASPFLNPEPSMLWSIQVLDETLIIPIFQGVYAPIGMFLLASLWLALMRWIRRII